MNKSILLIPVLLLALVLTVHGQVKLPRETVAVHINSDFLLTGETLLYKIHCQSNEGDKPGISRVAYVELIDGDAKPVIQAKISLVNGEGSGDFFLTSKLNSDHYTLVAYTQWMKNFDHSGFFRKEITIINPFRIQTQTNFVTGNSSLTTKIPLSQSSKSITIETQKDVYSKREKVVTMVNAIEEVVGGLTLSVRLADSWGAEKDTPSSTVQQAATSSNMKLPELRGKMISGIATDAAAKPLTNKIVFLSVPGKDYFFHAARTDTTGRFNFILEFMPLPRHLTIQCEKTDGPVTIAIDNDFLDQYDSFKPSPFKFDSSLTRVIERRSVYSQLENSYYSLKRDSSMTFYPGRFYGKPDKSYLLDAYTRFPTMEDVFREYVVEVVVRKRDEKFELKVISGKTRLPLSGDPVVLLDGILIQDIKTVMDYDPKFLKKIEIVTRKYFLGPATFSGIISLETYDGDARQLTVAPATKFEYDGLQPAKLYFSPIYPVQSDKLQRIPDYRVQLLWAPNVRLNKQGEIDFYTSDVPGTFEISIQGISRVSGPFRATRLIRVVP